MKHKPSQIWGKYKLEGEKAAKQGRECPRCGTGTFLAIHKNRVSCGKCGFAEIKV